MVGGSQQAPQVKEENAPRMQSLRGSEHRSLLRHCCFLGQTVLEPSVPEPYNEQAPVWRSSHYQVPRRDQRRSLRFRNLLGMQPHRQLSGCSPRRSKHSWNSTAELTPLSPG